MGRVSSIFAVALLVLAGAAGATGSATLAGATTMSTSSQENILNWPIFHHDLSRLGYSGSIAPSSSNLIWSFRTGNYVYSSPAVAEDGTTYVGTAPGTGDGGSLYAINLDGTLKWSFATGGGIYSSAAIGPDNTIYVGSDDYKLYALYDNGSLKWFYNTGGFVQSSPAVDANGDIYVGSSTGMFALKTDGTLKWSYATGTVTSSPAVTNGRVYVGSYDDKVYCLNAENGSPIWSFITGGAIYSSPAVAYGKIFIGSRDRNVYCLDAENGTQVWSYTTNNAVWSSPAVAQGKVFVGSSDYEIYCFDAENGSLGWKFTTGYFVYSSPAIAHGKLLIGSYDTKVYCFGITYKVSISISPSYQRGPPGGMLDYTVTVVNTGGGEDTYTLTVGDNSGWSLMLSKNLLENVQPGENRVVTLSVVIPENAENCTKDNITVTATSHADNTIKAIGSCVAHATFTKVIIYPTADVYAFGGYSRSQLKFDISSIPSGSNVFSAKLWLHRFAADGWVGNVTLSRVDNQLWGETITASEFDAQTLTNVENYAGKFTSHGWDNLNLLDQLKVDYDIGHTYASFRLRWTNDNGGSPSIGINDGRFLAIESQTDNLLIVFNSREYDNQDPYIEVTYVPPQS